MEGDARSNYVHLPLDGDDYVDCSGSQSLHLSIFGRRSITDAYRYFCPIGPKQVGDNGYYAVHLVDIGVFRRSSGNHDDLHPCFRPYRREARIRPNLVRGVIYYQYGNGIHHSSVWLQPFLHESGRITLGRVYHRYLQIHRTFCCSGSYRFDHHDDLS